MLSVIVAEQKRNLNVQNVKQE